MVESKLKNSNLLLAVTGGIAAYKAVDLASRLTRRGAMVKTIMTESACQLIGAKSFEAVTAGSVYTSLWTGPQEYKIGHINLADWADVVVVAPATANIIAKIANGICDELVSTVLCACWNKSILCAPAMNDKMWSNPAVQKNVARIKDMGIELTGPEKGHLACGTDAVGRMSEPEDILSRIERIVAKTKRKRK